VRSRWPVWLGGGAAALLMVAVAIAGNQAYSDGRLRWAWLAAALLAASLTVLVDRKLADQTVHGILRRALTDVKGRPLLLSQVTPRQLGVHRSRFGPHGQFSYIQRDVDQALDAALDDPTRRLVVVQGPRLAGTTSTLAQAAQSRLAGCHVLAFIDDPRLTVTQMLAQAHRWASNGPGAVLWLDDLTPDHLAQLDHALHEGAPDRLWIMATLHDKHRTGYRTPEHLEALLEDKAVCITVGAISPAERDTLRAEDLYADLRPALDAGDDLLMGRLMVSLDQIHQALTPGRGEESNDRIALLRAVTDWRRAAMPTPLTRPVLAHLHAAYRQEIASSGRRPPASAIRFKRALAWATAASSRTRPQLVDLQPIDHADQYVPHPLLTVAADDTGYPGAWTIAAALWKHANHTLTGDQRRDLGYTALDHGAHPHARQLLDHADAEASPQALHDIAEWLRRTGQPDAARRWYARVIRTGDPKWEPHVMADLGALEREQGRLAEAAHWWERAAAISSNDQMPRAVYNLGVLEHEQGRLAEAAHWWEQAAATGHDDRAPAAMVNLGTLERGQGHPDEAATWYRQVIATGHHDYTPQAMLYLGFLEQGQAHPDEAATWYRQVIATGHHDHAPVAMYNLGVLEHEQDRLAEAAHWWEQAAATSHRDSAPTAMYNLGLLEYEQGRVAEAARWWEQAAATGHDDRALAAMVELGSLERGRGRPEEAATWYRQVIGTGHHDHVPRAMIGLGLVEQSQGRSKEAARWWEQAAATGHHDHAAVAMLNLGLLAKVSGNLGEARRWWKRVIDMGHSESRADAQQQLHELDRIEEDTRRAEQFGRYGWQARADPELMRPPHAAGEPAMGDGPETVDDPHGEAGSPQ
jgi:tetratricopeptide (TPR) repeat protein